MKRANLWLMVLAHVLVLGMCVSASAASAPTATPLSSDPEDIVATALESLSEQTKDPWQKAIYDAGAQDVVLDGTDVRFLLRSFNPVMKTMPDYEEDPKEWRDAFFSRIQAYDLEITVALDGDALSSSGTRKLKSAVSKAAETALAAFDRKNVREALVDLLFAQEDSPDLALLLAAQSKQSLSVKKGPHNLTLTCTGADPQTLAKDARKAAMAHLARFNHAFELHESQIEQAYMDALSTKAASIRKQGGKAHAFVLDVDALDRGDFGEDYKAYVLSFGMTETLEQLISDVRDLPDTPAVPFPQSGRIFGGNSGTKVILKVPDNDLDYYVQMRKADTDYLAADALIRSGDSVTAYVPQGMYYLLIASGETWFGLVELFGKSGNYSQTELTEILSKDYYHTLRLESEEDGNVSVYDANPSSFLIQ